MHLNQLLPRLLNGMMVGFHLLGKILLKHGILLYLIMPETESNLFADLYGCFTVSTVVEPCLRPPVDATLVCIDADLSRYVETLDVYLEISQRVDDSLFGYGIGFKFFF